ncbi:MAG: PEP-CTERM sorting domain-containing protein [Verrucomicrobiota bacterium]
MRKSLTLFQLADIDSPKNVDPSNATVPEPSQIAALILLVAGIAGLAIVRRRKALGA